MKSRPVISAPKPANPIYLKGHKWKHVIVTIPRVDEPPLPPPRKKRAKSKGSKLSLSSSSRISKKFDAKVTFSELMNAIQLRRYFCGVLKIGINFTDPDGSRTAKPRQDGDVRAEDDAKKYPGDLFFSTVCGNGFATAIMVSVPAAFPIDCSQNRSLTNESTDSFFHNSNVCVYGFKNFLLLHSPKRDLDKLDFTKICQRLMINFFSKWGCGRATAEGEAVLDEKFSRGEKLMILIMLKIISDRIRVGTAAEQSTLSMVEDECSSSSAVSNEANQPRGKRTTHRRSGNIGKVSKKMKNAFRGIEVQASTGWGRGVKKFETVRNADGDADWRVLGGGALMRSVKTRGGEKRIPDPFTGEDGGLRSNEKIPHSGISRRRRLELEHMSGDGNRWVCRIGTDVSPGLCFRSNSVKGKLFIDTGAESDGSMTDSLNEFSCTL